ncbi:transposase [Actinomyces ruminis]|uniref:transposase n=1 Tax=Actinomyces ruminis TaxID=1937003 RepID=UPI003B849933
MTRRPAKAIKPGTIRTRNWLMTGVFRRLLQAGLQDLVDAEASAVIGADRYERTQERRTRRNGTRAKKLATTAGEAGPGDPQTAAGLVLSLPAVPAQTGGARPRCAVICQAWTRGGVHPEGRRSGQGAG